MNAKLATLGMAITFLVGFGLNTAVAVAQPDSRATTERSTNMDEFMGQMPEDMADVDIDDMHAAMGASMAAMPEGMAGTDMDGMHAAMRYQMPADMRDDCDEMHAAMVDRHNDDMPPRDGRSMSAAHDRHHR